MGNDLIKHAESHNPMVISDDNSVIVESINQYLYSFDDLARDFPQFKELIPVGIEIVDSGVGSLLTTIRDTPEILDKVTLVKGFVGDALHILVRLDQFAVLHDSFDYETDNFNPETPEELTAICEKFESIDLCLDKRTTEGVLMEMKEKGFEF
ncbi:hypothetical protein ACFYU8_18030 [Brevibacillus sp. NPDC003359]|uniref:hypothetical protein n=1 Tax=unclassified Brevibacillus TaxID=2684853 RepID=UPI00368451A7